MMTLNKGTTRRRGYIVNPYDGVSNFITGKTPGLNVQRLAFQVWAPWTPTAWTDFMTSARWTAITSAGFSHIRIAIDPQVFLDTDGSDAQMAPLLAIVKGAIDDCVSRGTKAIVDMHWWYDTMTQMFAGYAANNAFHARVLDLLRTFGRLLNGYATTQVCFEVWNETTVRWDAPAAEITNYLNLVRLYSETFRETNKVSKILISPHYYAGIEPYRASTTLFNAAHFSTVSAPKGYVLHVYDPSFFTHQAVPGVTDFIKHNHRMPFPGGTLAARDAHKTSTFAEIDADATFTQAQKDAAKNDANYLIDYYWDNYATAPPSAIGGVPSLTLWDGWFGDYGSYFTGGVAGNSPTDPTNVGTHIEAWRVANGVARHDIHVTEFGVHRDYDKVGASLTAAADWMAMLRRYLDARGYNRTAWCEDDAYWSLRQDSPAGGEVTPVGAFEPTLLTAIGL